MYNEETDDDMFPLISVIVPIYGIDRYVGLCIESILNQTYTNIEIILVDDGSPDRCPEICELYSRKDNRIRVIHKKNGGLVSARKAGLRESSGDYVAYVDGDDWIDTDFIEKLYFSIGSADIVCAGFTRDLFNKTAKLLNEYPLGVYEGDKLRALLKSMISYGSFYQPGITTYVWNKLFKRVVLLEPQNKVDNRITIGEDAAVTYPVLLKSKKVVITSNTSYHYRQREDSMLKQRADYCEEAKKLKFLYDYMRCWAESTDYELGLASQVNDFILANAIMRSGGRLPNDDYSTFGPEYYGKDVVICNAGTFGQQLVNRFGETKHCRVVAWIDDDYWEYRRCGLDVDPVESVRELAFDYVLIAKVDRTSVNNMVRRLMELGVPNDKLLTVKAPSEKEVLIKRFLNVQIEKKKEVISHA